MKNIKLVLLIILFSLLNESCKTTYSNFGGGFSGISSYNAKIQKSKDSSQIIKSFGFTSSDESLLPSQIFDTKAEEKISNFSKKSIQYKVKHISSISQKKGISLLKLKNKLQLKDTEPKNTKGYALSVIAFIFAMIGLVLGIIGMNTHGLGNPASLISLLFAIIAEFMAISIMSKNKGSIIHPKITLTIVLITCILWFIGCKNALSGGGW